MRDTLQLMKILTLTDGFNYSWVKHGLSDDVAVLRSCVATLPLLSLQILVSVLSGWRNFCWDFLQWGLSRSAAWTLIAVRSRLSSLVERRERTLLSRIAMQMPRWFLVETSTVTHLSSYIWGTNIISICILGLRIIIIEIKVRIRTQLLYTVMICS